MTYPHRTRDQHFTDPGPKRILALDGGGVRGVLTLGYLARIEALLRARHGDDPSFRLADYYDLIAGTSTGAIIAAALAQGMLVSEVRERYMRMGPRIFQRSAFRHGVLRAKFDEGPLVEELRGILGDKTLGSPELRTGLLIVTKRLDTGSPWPLGNNPQGRFFRPSGEERFVSNADFPLWKVIRASAAAPSFFEPQRVDLTEDAAKPVEGVFVDGCASPHVNPALQALMYATLKGYRVGWPLGQDRLLLTSVGTGRGSPDIQSSDIARMHAMQTLISLSKDTADLVEILLQWMSQSPTARTFDSELGALEDDSLAPEPLFRYARYNVTLTPDALARDVDLAQLERQSDAPLSTERIAELAAMDEPRNLPILDTIGRMAADRQVEEAHFPASFDLASET